MDTKNDTIAVPVRPYDGTMWEHWSMYDNMPYVWDPDLNVERVFKYVSGNIIKPYRCSVKGTFEIKHE